MAERPETPKTPDSSSQTRGSRPRTSGTPRPHGTKDRSHPRNWKFESPTSPGFHLVVGPDDSPCQRVWAFRLNLNAGDRIPLSHKDLELNAAVIEGRVEIVHGARTRELFNYDSVYLPAGDEVGIRALENAVLYVGGARYAGVGEFYMRPFQPELPLGEIHQIHGSPPFEREVFMTVNQETPASRMIGGFTWGREGMWTSWPPHQHSADLEEVYCYLDTKPPLFCLHLCSRYPEVIEAVHQVSAGDFVVIPEGYHPTVAAPGTRSSYFWVMAAHSRRSRRCDLARVDFGFT